MKTDAQFRFLKKLDQRLLTLKPETRYLPPPKGWIKAIREALGMTGVQLARRLGVSPQSVDAMEKSETGASIKLETLRRAAEALNCTLVYALVPNTSLEQSVSSRARKIAIAQLGMVSHTMKLEDQETGDEDIEDRIDSYIREHIRERELWERT